MKTLILLGSFLSVFVVMQAQAQSCPSYICKSKDDVCYKELGSLNPKVSEMSPSAPKWRVNICELFDSSSGQLKCSSGIKVPLYHPSGNPVTDEYVDCDKYSEEAEFKNALTQLNQDIKAASENPVEEEPVSSPEPTPSSPSAPVVSEQEKNGECGVVTAAEAGLEGKEINSGGSVRTVKGSWKINSCSVYDAATKTFKCSAGKTIEILDGEDVYTTLFCDKASDKEATDYIIQKLNEMEGMATYNPMGDMRDFFVMKECTDETDEALIKAGRCYSDKVENVNNYEQLLTLMTVTLLGYKLPLVCENAANQADIVSFQAASYNYLNAEQLAYGEYMLFLKEIKAFSPTAWYFVDEVIKEKQEARGSGSDESNPYWGYFLTPTEEKVKASMTGTGDPCETVEVGDQLKALIQHKMNYLAMAKLIEDKILNYEGIASEITTAASISHSMAASLDAAWASCESAATATAAGCAAMVATGVALSANPKTRPLGMLLIALGTYGLITVAGLSGAADDLESALRSGGDGNTPSKSSYPPVTSALADVKSYGDRTLACGSLRACSTASDKEKETLVTCDPTKMTCAALGVGDELAPGATEIYNSSTERFSQNALKAQDRMKAVARYLTANLSPENLGEVLTLLEARFLVNKVYAASRSQVVTSSTVNNNIVTEESKVFQKEYQVMIEDLKSRLELLNAHYEAKLRSSSNNFNNNAVSQEETRSYEERKVYIKTLNDELAKVQAGNLTVAQLQESVAKVQEIQKKTDADATVDGSMSSMPIAIPVANNDSPIECDYLPASKFEGCWKDASFSRPPQEVRTTKSINLCSFYNKEHDKFDFCLAGQSATKIARFDVLRTYTDMNGNTSSRKVTYYKTVNVGCYNVTGSAADAYTTGTNEKGEGTAALAGGGHPTMEQAWHMEEMSCVINAMNEELQKLPKEEMTPAPKDNAFKTMRLQSNGSFNCGEACGDSTKGDGLKGAFGLWDDAVDLLRGDNGYEPVLYSAAVEADKGILSPRYRAVLFETIAQEIESIRDVLGGEGGMLKAVQSNITNVTKLLRDTELKTSKLNTDLCEETVGKSAITNGENSDSSVGTQVSSKRPPGAACPTGQSSNGICSNKNTADKLTSNTLRSGALNTGTGPKLSKSVISGINSRVSLSVGTSSIFASSKYNGSDAWGAMTKSAAQLSSAKRDLAQIKSFRNELDKANGARPTNYDSFVKRASESMDDIFASSAQASKGVRPSAGSSSAVVPELRSSSGEKEVKDSSVASEFFDEFTIPEVPVVSSPTLATLSKKKEVDANANAPQTRIPADNKKYDYAKYGKKEEDQSFESKIHGSRGSLFEILSKRYIKTGLKRVNYVER